MKANVKPKHGVACYWLMRVWFVIEPGNAGLATKCHSASDKLSSAECHTCSTLLTGGKAHRSTLTQTDIETDIYVFNFSWLVGCHYRSNSVYIKLEPYGEQILITK